ncbi:taste receptor type 2 member 140-like [Phyllobates terribilis]|uniref:taste receptor type 2 member 140-like n=1 Tax=Phyllobates terribilis TaxID=111132 RepID=UPI003CCA8245
MVTALNIFLLLVVIISGIILCSSIVIVYIFEWKKNQQISVHDKIFIYSAITNLLLQFSTSLNSLINTFWFYQVMSKPGSMLVLFFNFFFIYDNIWHTAWLSIHYCLKLVNSSHRVLLQMKKRLSTSIIPLLLVTSAVMVLINLPYIWTVRIKFLLNETNSFKRSYVIHRDNMVIICNISIGCCLPFLVTVTCIGLSVRSLVRHMWKMRSNTSHFSSSPQLQGHFRAAMTMILQLLLNLFLYLCVIGVYISSFYPGTFWEVFFWSSILCYPSAQTITLILGNPKLKKRLFGQKVKK